MSFLPAGRLFLVMLPLALTMSACGGKKQSSVTSDVEMRNMQVVDGTTSDAMTDLDGAREGSLPAAAGNGAAAASKAAPARAGNAAKSTAAKSGDAEVVSDD